jgi:hypothetical protein
VITKKLIFSVILFLLGNIIIWYQANSQFVWKWWEDKSVLSVLLLGVPAGFCYYYGWQLAVKEFNSLWSARLFSYALSYFAFPIMTWIYMNETPFSMKTITCIILSLLIVLVQICC